MFGLYFGGVLIGVILFVVVGGAIQAHRRRERLQEMARENGWSYEREGGAIVPVLSHLPLFGWGRRRTAENVLRQGSGVDERWVFDYRYTVRSGKQSRTYRQTVIAFPYLDVNLPAFELRPEHFFHKLGALFGFQDIDLPAHPEFSSRHLLRGREVSDIRHLFDGELVEVLRDPSVCIEGDGSCLLFYRSRRTIPADGIMPAIEEASHLCAAVRQRAIDLGWTAQDVPQETALV